MTYIYNTGETEEELRKTYNYKGSELRKAQERMVEMLVFLDKVCKENNITYFIAFGTLLGAKRHEGFIPWDDDLDVYISAKELKRLRRIINSLDCDYVVQDFSIDKGFVRHYNVLRDLNSEYMKSDFIHNQRKYRGLQIDLFPYDYGVIEFGKKIVKKIMYLNEHYFLGRYPFFSGLFFYLNRYIVIPFFKLLSKFKGSDVVFLGYEGVDSGYRYLKTDIFPLSSIEFEGIMVPTPNNIERVLEQDYGSTYMDLPKLEERNKHCVSKIVFY